MLQRKDTTNISELISFFTSSEKVCETVLWIIRSLKLNSKQFNFSDSDRLIYSSGNVLTLLLLFPLFQLENVRKYSQSSLFRLFKGGKDRFYRFKKNELVEWRAINYKITLQLIRMTKSLTTDFTTGCRCLVADDTDLPNTSRSIELMAGYGLMSAIVAFSASKVCSSGIMMTRFSLGLFSNCILGELGRKCV